MDGICLFGVVAAMQKGVLSCSLALFRILKPIPKQSEICPIFELPPEMILEILRNLTPLSQACLILTCKRFYYQFSPQVLQVPSFRYPSPAVSSRENEYTRTDLLVMLEAGGSKRWLFCDSCLMLHPRDEFDDFSATQTHAPRQCKWPGVIQPCSCLRFSPKRLIQIAEELEKAYDKNSLGLEVRKYIHSWHQCRVLDPLGTSTYDISISISLDEKRNITFYIIYMFERDQSTPHQDRVIPMCRHAPSHEDYNRESRPVNAARCFDPAGPTCTLRDHLFLITCSSCAIVPITKEWNHNGQRICSARFVRVYRVPNMEPGHGEDMDVDYDWSRYGTRASDDLRGRALKPAGRRHV